MILLLGLLLVSCTQDAFTDVPSPTLDNTLEPYLTSTPRSTPKSVKTTSEINPTKTLTLTPTPFVYQVVENDTLTGIALRHSVTLEGLIAANPGIDPNFLTIGLTLTIPLDGVEVSASLPTATPVPVVVLSPSCYPLADGNLQCMAIVENDQLFAVENVEALISLQPADGSSQTSKTAITPLNWIPAGQKSVLVTTFEIPLSQDYKANVSLLTAIPIEENDQRYLQPGIENQTSIIDNRKQARVSGSLILSDVQANPTVIWIVALAYDSQNNIVGIRKWIADESLLSEAQVDFDFTVYSLGPAIDHVEVQAEVRPQQTD
jgi:LysM repeat protein